jgi:hypothetical protein
VKSNTKEVRKAIQKHIIEICENDDVKIETLEEAKQYIIDNFNNFINAYELRKHKTIQEAFIYWLSGLALHTHYMTSDIIDYLHSIGLYGKNEKQENETASKLYHYLIFRECSSVIINNLKKI